MKKTTNHDALEQKWKALLNRNIKADANQLVEAIRRQFSNREEYARELVANGLDAGATRIRIRGDVREDAEGKYTRKGAAWHMKHEREKVPVVVAMQNAVNIRPRRYSAISLAIK
jgi:hypothetical protein